MAALSQLSYSPELVIGSHCNAALLVVSGRREAKMERRLPDRKPRGHVETPLEPAAVDPEGVDLVEAVPRPHVPAGRRVSARSDVDDDEVGRRATPLALHALDA